MTPRFKSLFLRAVLATGAAATLSFATTSASAQDKIVVGASPVPHAEILNFVKPALKAQGVDLEVKIFTDYVQPNLAVEDKQLDANYFQHKPYLDTFNKERGTHVVIAPSGLVHVEPFGAYSKRISSIKELREGATVALPNDPSNGGRALLLLQQGGLIKLKDPANLLSTPRDIADNPKKLKFTVVEAAQLPRVLPDVDLALINTNYALEAKLVPTRDALLIEGADSPYANFIAVRPDNAQSAAVRKLIAALHAPETRKFIADKYKGAIVPAF
ncbi:D-methionine transport system substrate-binding protein [Comamonas sp. BIGb0124]|uniref:MetQ/NlpA family ABC transporter substrate-binding protein n=1 Tax=Comamonas sp. BIGb0124 TaxID=2485130 RepID=UPI000F47EE6B|nr:MetQ/NlpA family ABC transporter substrate-binding protein [Comamonas sp. BIGb0124]ROR22585.1 D-methionine transport system substrate-binding protein [Comamonas sp. BIGb0124]